MNVIRLSDEMAKPVWAKNAQVLMKQKDLIQADLLEVFQKETTGAIGHYFNGRRQPTIDSIIRLADFLEINLVDLVYEEKDIRKDIYREAVQIETKKDSNLTEALKILVRTSSISDEDVLTFFKVYSEIGPDRIATSANKIMEGENQGLSKMEVLLDIQDYVKKAV